LFGVEVERIAHKRTTTRSSHHGHTQSSVWGVSERVGNNFKRSQFGKSNEKCPAEFRPTREKHPE